MAGCEAGAAVGLAWKERNEVAMQGPIRKVLAGDLSATFNLDGRHLDRYIERRLDVVGSLCEQLLLHDQVMIPTQDYLTACGLIRLLGEGNVISLLEKNELRFVRLRGVFGYVRGTGADGGLGVFEDPEKKRWQDSPIEDSIEAALRATGQYKEHKKLASLLTDQSYPVETSAAIDYVRHDAFRDLKETPLWRDLYQDSNPDVLRLPGMEEMQVRVLGPSMDVSTNVVDALLALALTNLELYLSEKFECDSTSSGSPIGDAVALKLQRIYGGKPYPSIWSFLEIARVPNPAQAILSETRQFKRLLKIRRSGNGVAFREWFHRNRHLSEREFLAAYVDLLHEVPWIQKGPVKILRFVLATAADAIPGLGTTASAIDTFVVERLLRGKSPRYFIEDLRRFSGRIPSRK